jgi:hypothetical protein
MYTCHVFAANLAVTGYRITTCSLLSAGDGKGPTDEKNGCVFDVPGLYFFCEMAATALDRPQQ